MAKLESLIVDLQLNTAELRKGLDESNAKLDLFGKRINSLAGVIELKAIGEMAIAVSQKLGAFVLRGAETADRMGKMAQAVGVSVEELSRYNYAAGLSGVSTETLGIAFKKLNANISDVATGSAKSVALFQALGVSVKDSSGNVRTAGAVMQDLAGALGKMKDGASKAKIEMALFGSKTGVDMTAMMNLGKEGLKQLADESDRFGITISKSASASAEQFKDNLERLQAVVNAVAVQVSANLAPSLAALTTELLNSEAGANGMAGSVEFLSNLLRVAASGAVLTAGAFQSLGLAIAKVASTAADYYNGTSSKDLTGNDRKIALVQLAEARQDLTDLQRNASQAATGGAAPPAVGALVAAVDMAQARVDKLSASLGSQLGEAHPVESNPLAPLEEALKRVSTIWETTSIAAKKSAEVQKTSGDEIAKAFADQTELIAKQKKALAELADAAAKSQRELEKLATTQAFNRERSAAGQSASNDERTTAFNNIGAPSFAQTMKGINEATRGFADFNDALAKMSIATYSAAELHDSAALETKRASDAAAAGTKALAAGLTEQAAQLDATSTAATTSAQSFNLAGDSAERAAARGDKAADAFSQLAELVIQRQQQIVSMSLSVLSGIGKSGNEVAKLVTTAMEGFKSGGIIGAFIAVIVDLFSKLASVGKFIDSAFGSFMDAFSQLDEGFSVLFSALTDSLVPVMKGLSTTFGLISRVLTPIFEALETIMKPFEQLANSLMALLDATGILDFVIKIVAGVFNVIGMVVGSVVLGIQYLWAGILRAVRAVIAIFTLGQGTKEIDKTIAEQDAVIEANKKAIARSAANIGSDSTSSSGPVDVSASGPVTATGPVTSTGMIQMKSFDIAKYLTGSSNGLDPKEVIDIGGQGYAAGSVAGAEAARGFVEATALINGETADAAAALGEVAYNDFLGLGTAADTAAGALNKFSQSLTNVPTGFKYALGAFNATMAGSGVSGDAGRLPGAIVIENLEVHGSVLSENSLADLIASIQSRRNFRRTGTMISNIR